MGGSCSAPFFLHQDGREALHRKGYANIDVLSPAPAAPQVDGPAAEEGEEDGVVPEQGDKEAGSEAEVLRRRAARGVVQVGEAVGVVDLRRQFRVLLHLSLLRTFYFAGRTQSRARNSFSFFFFFLPFWNGGEGATPHSLHSRNSGFRPLIRHFFGFLIPLLLSGSGESGGGRG